MNVGELRALLDGMPVDARVDAMIYGYPQSAFPLSTVDLLKLNDGKHLVVVNCVEYDPSVSA
jgi:hypothetical protein